MTLWQAAPPLALNDLGGADRLFLTRPTLFDYIATPEALRVSAERLFHQIGAGTAGIDIAGASPPVTSPKHTVRSKTVLPWLHHPSALTGRGKAVVAATASRTFS